MFIYFHRRTFNNDMRFFAVPVIEKSLILVYFNKKRYKFFYTKITVLMLGLELFMRIETS